MDKKAKKLQSLVNVLDRKFVTLGIQDTRWMGFKTTYEQGQLGDKALMRVTECLIDNDMSKKAADLLLICCDMVPEASSLLDYTIKTMRQIDMEKDAVAYLKKRIKQNSADWMTTRLLGRIYFHQEKKKDCISLVDQYLDHHGDYVPALIEKATLQMVSGGQDVEETLEKILKLDSNNLFGLSQVVQNKAQIYEFDAANVALEKLHKAHPDDAMTSYCEGFIFDQQLEFEKALICYEKAIEINPRFVEAFGKSGGMLTKLGRDLEEAWYRLEARFPQLINRPEGPFWRGEDLNGKSLLIWAEQGIADQLSFVTMFRDLPEGITQVDVETEPKMVSLFQRTFPNFKIYPRRKVRNQTYDYHTPMGAIARYLRPDVESFSQTNVHSFVVDAIQHQKWKSWLDSLPEGKKVGLCWRSGVKSVIRARDGLDLVRDLAPFLKQEGLVFINLHYADVAEELAQVKDELGITIYDPPDLDQFNDVDQSAALIKALDLFVGIATTPTRVAQSVGTKTALLYVGEPGLVERNWWPETEFFCRVPSDKDWSKQVESLILSANS